MNTDSDYIQHKVANLFYFFHWVSLYAGVLYLVGGLCGILGVYLSRKSFSFNSPESIIDEKSFENGVKLVGQSILLLMYFFMV